MKLLTNQNVESYYRQLDDMLGKACISNMKEEGIDFLCAALKMKIDTLNQLKRNLPPSGTILEKFALDLISDPALIESSKYLENRTEEQCDLTYDQDHNEYRIWIIALMTMSWIITNWKRKTEEGHCQNTKHWRDPQDSFCPMGSALKPLRIFSILQRMLVVRAIERIIDAYAIRLSYLIVTSSILIIPYNSMRL